MCIQQHTFQVQLGQTMTGLTFTRAKELVQDPYACFRLVTTKKYLALLPKYIGDLNKGVREQLDAEMNLFSPSLNGVMVAYSNVRRFQQHGTILGSQPYLHLYIQADFVVFEPTNGSILRAVVNKVGKDYIGCLVHGCFNASIPKRGLEALPMRDVDITMDQTFLFQVTKYYANNGILSIRGVFYEDSFTTISSEPVSRKRKADELDGQNLDFSEELPDMIHRKRRRTNSTTTPTPAVTSNPFTQPADFAAALDSLQDETSQEQESAKKKKKKKKKHREEQEDEAGVFDNQLDLADHDSGILVNTPEPSDVETPKRKKKKKKDKRHSVEEEPTNGISEDNIMRAVNTEEVPSSQDNLTKKKKKKKHKHRDE